MTTEKDPKTNRKYKRVLVDKVTGIPSMDFGGGSDT